MKDINLKLEKVFKSKGPRKGGDAKQSKPKGSNKDTPNQKNNNTYACKKFSPKQGDKDDKTMNDKTYHCCNWNKYEVEHNTEEKVPNGCILRKNPQEENKPDSQGYAQALKMILTDITKES